MTKNKIRILFDAQSMIGQKTGVGYYTYSLIKAIADLNPDRIDLVGHYFNLLDREQADLPQAPNISYRVTRFIPKQLINQLRRFGINIPFELLVVTRGDFIIYPGFISRVSLFNTPSTVVIHDLAYLDHPQYVDTRNQRDLSRFVPSSLRRSKFIITVSEASRRVIKNYYPWLKKEVVVEHIPPPEAQHIDQTTRQKYLVKLGIKKPFILYVGTIEPRKNINSLLKAYDQLPPEIRGQYSLVLAGGKGWKDEDIRRSIEELKTSGLDIIETGYIQNNEKWALYYEATVLTLVSHYEGYGIQLLEAATAQLPVIASDLPVFREVIGNGAIYCNPSDPDNIADSIKTLISNTSLQYEVINHQKQVLENLSWESVAANILQKILDSTGR